MAYRGSRGIAALILNLGTRWRCVGIFTQRPLYPEQRIPAPTEYKAVSVPIAGLGGSGEERNLLLVPEMERTVQPVANRYIDCDIHRRDMKINYNQPFSNNRVSLANCLSHIKIIVWILRSHSLLHSIEYFVSGTRDLNSVLSCNYVSLVRHL